MNVKLRIIWLKCKMAVMSIPAYKFLYTYVGGFFEVLSRLFRMLRDMIQRVRMGMSPEEAAPRACRTAMRQLDEDRQAVKDRLYLANRKLDNIKKEVDQV